MLRQDQILDKGLKIDPESATCLKVLASLHLMKAEHFLLTGQAPFNEIRLGIEAANHAIEFNQNLDEAYGIRGKLFLLRSRLQSGSARLKAANEAVASFNHAFELNGNLRKEYDKDWEEAKRLAQN